MFDAQGNGQSFGVSDETGVYLAQCRASGSRPSRKFVESLRTALVAKNLAVVDLSGEELGPRGMECVCHILKRSECLTQLDLWSNSLGDDGAVVMEKSLANTKALNELKYLYAKYNGIGDLGTQAISRMLVAGSCIERLDLDSNSIGDEGCISLARALELPACKVEFLHLGTNSIGDAGVTRLSEALQKNRTLKELNLRNNCFGNSGAGELLKTLRNSRKNEYDVRLTTLHIAPNSNVSDELLFNLSEAAGINQLDTYRVPALKARGSGVFADNHHISSSERNEGKSEVVFLNFYILGDAAETYADENIEAYFARDVRNGDQVIVRIFHDEDDYAAMKKTCAFLESEYVLKVLAAGPSVLPPNEDRRHPLRVFGLVTERGFYDLATVAKRGSESDKDAAARKIIEITLYLRSKGMVHYDISKSSIVRCGKSWKLFDVAPVTIEELENVPHRTMAEVPPELDQAYVQSTDGGMPVSYAVTVWQAGAAIISLYGLDSPMGLSPPPTTKSKTKSFSRRQSRGPFALFRGVTGLTMDKYDHPSTTNDAIKIAVAEKIHDKDIQAIVPNMLMTDPVERISGFIKVVTGVSWIDESLTMTRTKSTPAKEHASTKDEDSEPESHSQPSKNEQVENEAPSVYEPNFEHGPADPEQMDRQQQIILNELEQKEEQRKRQQLLMAEMMGPAAAQPFRRSATPPRPSLRASSSQDRRGSSPSGPRRGTSPMFAARSQSSPLGWQSPLPNGVQQVLGAPQRREETDGSVESGSALVDNTYQNDDMAGGFVEQLSAQAMLQRQLMQDQRLKEQQRAFQQQQMMAQAMVNQRRSSSPHSRRATSPARRPSSRPSPAPRMTMIPQDDRRGGRRPSEFI